GDDAARADRVKYLVNRAYNEHDRSGAFSAESATVVERCERALKSLGERRNLRWFHRWGLPILALKGAAREAASAGLDARRALSLAQIAAGDESDLAASAIRRLADFGRHNDVAIREFADAARSIAAHLKAGTLTDEHVDSILAGLASAEPDAPTAADESA